MSKHGCTFYRWTDMPKEDVTPTLSRRLVTDGHSVHLYACRWDAAYLPAELHVHQLPSITGPRFLRPWRFGQARLISQACDQTAVRRTSRLPRVA